MNRTEINLLKRYREILLQITIAQVKRDTEAFKKSQEQTQTKE